MRSNTLKKSEKEDQDEAANVYIYMIRAKRHRKSDQLEACEKAPKRLLYSTKFAEVTIWPPFPNARSKSIPP